MHHTVKEERPDISIVMAVYKAEDWLEQALSSVCAQSFTNFELICIHDASPDSSLAILKKKAVEDPRIKIIDLAQNKGEAFAKNTGIDNARGNYLCFMDSDDILPKHSLAVRHSAALKHGADFVRARLAALSGNKLTPEKMLGPRPSAKEAVFETKQLDYGFLLPALTAHTASLFSLDFVRASGARFAEGMTIGPDLFFLMNMAYKVRKIVFIDEIVYHYRQLPDSVLGKNFNLKNYLDVFSLNKKFYALSAAEGLINLADAYFVQRNFCGNLLWLIDKGFYSLSDGDRQKVLNELSDTVIQYGIYDRFIDPEYSFHGEDLLTPAHIFLMYALHKRDVYMADYTLRLMYLEYTGQTTYEKSLTLKLLFNTQTFWKIKANWIFLRAKHNLFLIKILSKIYALLKCVKLKILRL